MKVDGGLAPGGVVSDDAIEARLASQEEFAHADVDAHEEAAEIRSGHVDLGVRGHLREADHLQGEGHQLVRVHEGGKERPIKDGCLIVDCRRKDL